MVFSLDMELKTIKVKKDTYEELMRLKGAETMRTGRYISLDDIIRMLLEVYFNERGRKS